MKKMFENLFTIIKFLVTCVFVFIGFIIMVVSTFYLMLYLPAQIGDYVGLTFSIVLGYFSWVTSSVIIWCLLVFIWKKIVKLEH